MRSADPLASWADVLFLDLGSRMSTRAHVRFPLVFEIQKVLSAKPLIQSMMIRFHHWLSRDELFETRSHIDTFHQLFFPFILVTFLHSCHIINHLFT